MGDDIPVVRTPAAREIASLVAGTTALKRLAAEAGVDVTRCIAGGAGEYRIGLGGYAAGEQGDTVQQVAIELAEHPAIDRAVARPPYVYCDPAADLLERTVAGDPLAGGARTRETVLVGFSDPNVNKPLHIGHLRNNALGMALAALLEEAGHRVVRVENLGDWGLHICQTMVAYERWGGGATPESAGIKPDHFVGRLYTWFHQPPDGTPRPHLDDAARALVGRLEAGDPGARALRETVVGWAEAGIRQTYRRIGTEFDVVCRESEALELAGGLVAEWLDRGVFARRADGSVYADLSEAAMGDLTVARADGSLLVYPQILAYHVRRWAELEFDRGLTLLGADWAPGIAAVDAILRRAGDPHLDRMERVFYGLVNLPEGRMRSRSATAVTVDDALDEVEAALAERTGPAAWVAELAAALVKYHLLRTPRTRDVTFSVPDVLGTTLPSFARVLRTGDGAAADRRAGDPRTVRPLLLHLDDLGIVVARALARNEPAYVVRYAEDLGRAAARCVASGALTPALAACARARVERALRAVGIAVPDVPRPALRALTGGGA